MLVDLFMLILSYLLVQPVPLSHCCCTVIICTLSAHSELTDCTKGHRVPLSKTVFQLLTDSFKPVLQNSFSLFQCVPVNCNMVCSYTFIDSMKKLKSC